MFVCYTYGNFVIHDIYHNFMCCIIDHREVIQLLNPHGFWPSPGARGQTCADPVQLLACVLAQDLIWRFSTAVYCGV